MKTNYPCIKKHQSSFNGTVIVYFTAPKTGFVLEFDKKDSKRYFMEYQTEWDEEKFDVIITKK